MDNIGLDINRLIPHRKRMKLVENVIEANSERAVTEFVVETSWPLQGVDSVESLILIELVAQTAGIYIGWQEQQKNDKISGKGWLVGIKRATFFLDEISLGTRIRIITRKTYGMENYTEIEGDAEIESVIVAKIQLQVVRVE